MGVLQTARWRMIAGELPGVSKCRETAHAGDRPATLHGVVFDILDAGPAIRVRGRLRGYNCPGVCGGSPSPGFAKGLRRGKPQPSYALG